MIVIRTHPDSTPAPAERFTGSVFVDELAIAETPSRLRAFSVHFTPGARSAWHCHPFGQILHVTEGVGRVQAEGGLLHEIRAGDTIVTNPGEYHWHGAAPGTFMTHIAIQEADDDRVDASWREHVDVSTYTATPDAQPPT
ncbi:(R)-mandelonitrile lyase [Frankia sp. AiPs1]|uniref:(R)-mandelonitrile lyase n=1 Tax=Frankia sp. AiPa1 TaxID=573492 RepID=UPI00202B7DA8|nr:cupin domain-containing protein [Frankia sp. AiPa1]MCL9762260.1 cupin domain-containing protein [Frankia sp. AiPa1]